MFYLTDGRQQLYQWDLNVKLLVSQLNVTEVHFCNGCADEALVVKTYVENSRNYVNIPNILLQSALPIKAYAYVNDSYTQECKTFKITKRNKPSDYVYEETEVLQWSTLDKRMNELEDTLPILIEDEVQTYLEEHPMDVDLSDYYTKEEVDTAISNIDIPEGGSSDTYFFDPRALNEEDYSSAMDSYRVSEHLSEFCTRFSNGEAVALYIYDEKLSRYFPAECSFEEDSRINAYRILSVSDIDKGSYTANWYFTHYVSGWRVREFTTGVFHEVSSKAYVADQLNQANHYADRLFNGANKAVAFDSYEGMINSINQEYSDTYQIGQNIMIVTLNVPDLWVSSLADGYSEFTYNSDEDITTSLESNGSIQVGYYWLSALETQKVDLTEYATTQYVNDQVIGVNTKLDNKLDKVTSSGTQRLYGINSSGNQTTYTVAPGYSSTYASAVVQRNSKADVQVPTTPSSNNAATSKSYVDTQINNVKAYVDEAIQTALGDIENGSY